MLAKVARRGIRSTVVVAAIRLLLLVQPSPIDERRALFGHFWSHILLTLGSAHSHIMWKGQEGDGVLA